VVGDEIHPFDARLAVADTCEVTTVAVDTSQASQVTHMGLRCGEAGGQAFVALDTLIRSVSVWRVAPQTPYGGHLKLWITEADSTGVPQLDRRILDGPVITVPFGDGIHPIRMEWSFDPPIALPHRGRYYFTAQDWCGGNWSLLASTTDPYTGGQAWRSGITCFDPEGCNLYRTPQGFASYDLVFTIEFCSTEVTPLHRGSWGRLKVIYR
jgi:hypothetical protein